MKKNLFLLGAFLLQGDMFANKLDQNDVEQRVPVAVDPNLHPEEESPIFAEVAIPPACDTQQSVEVLWQELGINPQHFTGISQEAVRAFFAPDALHKEPASPERMNGDLSKTTQATCHQSDLVAEVGRLAPGETLRRGSISFTRVSE